MRYEELVAYYGGLTKAATALGVSKQTIHRWKAGRVPTKWQYRLRNYSKGKLQPSPDAVKDAREMLALVGRKV